MKKKTFFNFHQFSLNPFNFFDLWFKNIWSEIFLCIKFDNKFDKNIKIISCYKIFEHYLFENQLKN
jgi:hypothetical protein